MRKANKSIDELIKPAKAIATPSAVPDSIIKLIAEQGEAELSSAKSNAEYYRNEITEINRRIEDYKRKNVNEMLFEIAVTREFSRQMEAEHWAEKYGGIEI